MHPLRQLAWRDVTRAVLVMGPPGSAKTALARMIAEKAGVRWWRVRWRSGRWRVRAAFAMDAEQAPAVIYTDELDAFGDRARPRDHNSSYTDYIITGLLDLIDGFHDHQGGLVMGATNHNRPLLAEIAQVLGDTGLLSGPRGRSPAAGRAGP